MSKFVRASLLSIIIGVLACPVLHADDGAADDDKALLAKVKGAGDKESTAGEWTREPLSKLLPGGEETEEEQVKLIGKIVAKDEKDEEGNVISRAFLEQDDETLIPLPCEKKDKEKGLIGKALDKGQSCWDFMGEKVELVGNIQSIHKKGKRFHRLAAIAGISVLK
jgi:hypothetical protein